jgi:hypothetical protein
VDSSSAGEGSTVFDGTTGGAAVQEYRISKFHLVDLAGSERVRRIGVTAGMRFKETVNINQVCWGCAVLRCLAA